MSTAQIQRQDNSSRQIQRQYDELIVDHYDHDPHAVIGDTLSLVLEQLSLARCLDWQSRPLEVLDIGMGTGLFLEKLRAAAEGGIVPNGVDLSARMLEVAHRRLPDLQYVVGDAGRLDEYFPDRQFDLICTHFVTGFVPVEQLAPQVLRKLKPGGYWSLAGATSAAYPQMRRKAASRPVQMVMGNRRLDFSELLTPADCDAVTICFEQHGLEVCEAETFEPEVRFANFDQFMQFAYHGGWLTPFIEDLGLQHARLPHKLALNLLAFPLVDHHSIAVTLARKPFDD